LKSLEDDELTDALAQLVLIHAKHLLQGCELERLVLAGSTVEECFKSGLLESVSQVFSEVIVVEVRDLFKKIDLHDSVHRLLPITAVQGASCFHDVIFVVLGSQVESLTIVVLSQPSEGSGNWSFVQGELVLSESWNLKQHAANKVHAL